MKYLLKFLGRCERSPLRKQLVFMAGGRKLTIESEQIRRNPGGDLPYSCPKFYGALTLFRAQQRASEAFKASPSATAVSALRLCRRACGQSC